LKADSFLCKLSPLDRFDTVIPHGRFEECAGTNGDWIATASLGGKWELATCTLFARYLSQRCRLKPPTIQIFLAYSGFAAKLMKIAICQVPTAAGRYKYFSLLAVFNNRIVVLHGGDD
jgi:hypothetical protein